MLQIKEIRKQYQTGNLVQKAPDGVSLTFRDCEFVAILGPRLYKMYDKIEDLESQLIEARAKKQTIEAEKLTGNNIYKVLVCFDQLYGAMNEIEKRQLMEELIEEVQIYEERQPNGQWLKSIKFKLPIIEEDMGLSLDNEEHNAAEEIVLSELIYS